MNKKDKHSKRGLVMLVSQRKKLLKYLRRVNPDLFKSYSGIIHSS
ncbi:MAG: hypothetical protein Ct9H90mP7_4380 [Candidatus Neomarinimicrobiota bacterium]|nr:MAG: hypothetical protein Ct9H90mP7_4380 [Candidatus Neomarinimicrobiota bacterium]